MDKEKDKVKELNSESLTKELKNKPETSLIEITEFEENKHDTNDTENKKLITKLRLLSDYKNYFRFKYDFAQKKILKFAFDPSKSNFYVNPNDSDCNNMFIFKPTTNIKNSCNENPNENETVTTQNNEKSNEISKNKNFSQSEKNSMSEIPSKISIKNDCILLDKNKYNIFYKENEELILVLVIEYESEFFQIFDPISKKIFLFKHIKKSAEIDGLLTNQLSNQNITQDIKEYCWEPFKNKFREDLNEFDKYFQSHFSNINNNSFILIEIKRNSRMKDIIFQVDRGLLDHEPIFTKYQEIIIILFVQQEKNNIEDDYSIEFQYLKNLEKKLRAKILILNVVDEFLGFQNINNLKYSKKYENERIFKLEIDLYGLRGDIKEMMNHNKKFQEETINQNKKFQEDFIYQNKKFQEDFIYHNKKFQEDLKKILKYFMFTGIIVLVILGIIVLAILILYFKIYFKNN